MSKRIQKTLNSMLLVACLSVSSLVLAQGKIGEVPHPKFSPFTGILYDMPEMKAPNGRNGQLISHGLQYFYSDTIYSYPQISEITLDKINIPESNVRDGNFPGVDNTTKFAMILHGKMEILVDGCYEFSLTSDDGSRLWINEKQIINNDGAHKLKTKIDSVAYKIGIYDVKLWYFQGMPDRFGFMMDAKIAGKLEVCPNDKVITLSKIIFDTDIYKIDGQGLEELKTAVIEIKKNKPSKIEIIGHTDDLGTEDYNQKLSLKRAQSVKRKLEQFLIDENIELIAIGQGSTAPIASNENIEGQKLNRRVELTFHH